LTSISLLLAEIRERASFRPNSSQREGIASMDFRAGRGTRTEKQEAKVRQLLHARLEEGLSVLAGRSARFELHGEKASACPLCGFRGECGSR
jgi:hypothetical protein